MSFCLLIAGVRSLSAIEVRTAVLSGFQLLGFKACVSIHCVSILTQVKEHCIIWKGMGIIRTLYRPCEVVKVRGSKCECQNQETNTLLFAQKGFLYCYIGLKLSRLYLIEPFRIIVNPLMSLVRVIFLKERIE